jgi:CubicO group peptidase (beta-lactamase class C family)
VRTPDELVARIGKAPLLHKPVEKFSYGFSTTVLGAVVERVSAEKLDRFLKRRILDPLDIRDTAFVIDDAHLPRLVTNYVATAEGSNPPTSPPIPNIAIPRSCSMAEAGLWARCATISAPLGC